MAIHIEPPTIQARRRQAPAMPAALCNWRMKRPGHGKFSLNRHDHCFFKFGPFDMESVGKTLEETLECGLLNRSPRQFNRLQKRLPKPADLFSASFTPPGNVHAW